MAGGRSIPPGRQVECVTAVCVSSDRRERDHYISARRRTRCARARQGLIATKTRSGDAHVGFDPPKHDGFWGPWGENSSVSRRRRRAPIRRGSTQLIAPCRKRNTAKLGSVRPGTDGRTSALSRRDPHINRGDHRVVIPGPTGSQFRGPLSRLRRGGTVHAQFRSTL